MCALGSGGSLCCREPLGSAVRCLKPSARVLAAARPKLASLWGKLPREVASRSHTSGHTLIFVSPSKTCQKDIL
jgi:hypothetical protein